MPEPDRSAYTQLEIYDGVLAAFERRAEVAEVLRTSADRTTAVRRLRAEFALTHLQATALLDLPLTDGVPRPDRAPCRGAAVRPAPLTRGRLAARADLRGLRRVGRMEG